MRPCVVPGCPSTDVTTISHRFPRRTELTLKWQRSLGLLAIDLDILLRKYVVCVEHFAPEDYRNALSKHLNSTAVPCLKGTSTSYTYGFHVEHTGQDVDDADPDGVVVNNQQVVVLVDSAGCLDQSPEHEHEPNADQHQSSTLLADLNFEEYITAEEPPNSCDELPPEQLDLQNADIAFSLSATAIDQSVADSVLIDLPDELIQSQSMDCASGTVVNLSGLGDQDSYVYLMEIDVPDCQLEATETNAEPSVENCQRTTETPEPNGTVSDCQLAGEQQMTDNNENAINLLLSAIADGPPEASRTEAEQPAENENTDEEEDEPYALHDTEEVRLYNEMSKRSLIQLLVAANGRIRDLEQRLETIESAHSKVLCSLELFRSVLKR